MVSIEPLCTYVRQGFKSSTLLTTHARLVYCIGAQISIWDTWRTWKEILLKNWLSALWPGPNVVLARLNKTCPGGLKILKCYLHTLICITYRIVINLRKLFDSHRPDLKIGSYPFSIIQPGNWTWPPMIEYYARRLQGMWPKNPIFYQINQFFWREKLSIDWN